MKQGKTDQKKSRKIQHPKPFVEGKRLPEPDIFKIPKEAPRRPMVRTETKNIEQEYLNKKIEAERAVAVLKKEQTRISEKVSRMNSVERIHSTFIEEEKKTTEKGMSVTLDQKNLVEGIILSEILGPPRARKPHRSIAKN
jgi:hypothetical protein